MTAFDAHAQVEMTASANASCPVWQVGADRVLLGYDHPFGGQRA